MGKSGNPAKAAREKDPLVIKSRKAMNTAMELVKDINDADMPHDIKVHAWAAACGLMAVYSYQTGMPPPWDVASPHPEGA